MPIHAPLTHRACWKSNTKGGGCGGGGGGGPGVTETPGSHFGCLKPPKVSD